jgi:hypothetical protein
MGFFVSISPSFDITDGAQSLLGFLWVVPEIGGVGQFFFFAYGLFLLIDVKGTSLRHRALNSGLCKFPGKSFCGGVSLVKDRKYWRVFSV